MSAIVDDTVENGFMKALSATLEKEPDNKALESDFNMNAKMVEYLRNKHNGRFVSGIKENSLKQNKKMAKYNLESLTPDEQTKLKEYISSVKEIKKEIKKLVEKAGTKDMETEGGNMSTGLKLSLK
jgi:DNA-directed RNA polymerase specialized sigma subunit